MPSGFAKPNLFLVRPVGRRGMVGGTMKHERPLILLFVDGLGLGEADPAVNPLYGGVCATLLRFITAQASPIDASLGVAGAPQSATGQTALLTGVNAPAAMGRHIEGFPGPRLREIIEASNIYKQLAARGRTGAFANAYYFDAVADVAALRVKSVTTVAALSGLGTVRTREWLLRNEAVYQDIVRAELRPRGYDGPWVAPADAARHLLGIAAGADVTLFEYFQTDRAGHRGDPAVATGVLGVLDGFLAPLLAWADAGEGTVVLTSDHGNIEDLRTPMHTLNPVPFAVAGPGAAALRARVRTIADVTPALVGFWG